METLLAFVMGERNKGNELMVFDWEKAAKIIKDRKPEFASAGLCDDWEYTGGTIYRNGKIITDDYTFLASTWAVPELCVDGEIIPCYKMKHEVPKWSSDTKWPNSARKIIEDKED